MDIYILKVLTNTTNDELICDVYTFASEKEVHLAASEMRRTKSPWFTAKIKDLSDTDHGKLIDQGNLVATYIPTSATYVLKWGNYRDTITRTFMPKEEAEEECRKTNDKREGWWSDHATITHIAGDLWAVDVTSPYTD